MWEKSIFKPLERSCFISIAPLCGFARRIYVPRGPGVIRSRSDFRGWIDAQRSQNDLRIVPENRCKRTEARSGMLELTEEGAGQDVAGGLDGRVEMVVVDVVIGWRLSINLKERAGLRAVLGHSEA